jgi:TRAP-type C4-dicarboxylate transport system substrate-binding protein
MVGLVGLGQRAQAAEVNLRFAHFWPAQAAMAKHWQSWAEAVEKDSNGRISVEMYPSQTLAKAPKTYDAVINGIADIGATVQGYTANRFPLTQVIELPGISQSGVHGSCIAQSLLDKGDIAEEYAETHPLFVFTHGPGVIHTKGKAVKTPADLKGLRIRRPTAVVAELLTGLGGQPVGMPAPHIYQSMSRGVINGATLPWEAMKSFRLNELADHHTDINLYTLSFVVTMNKRVYEGMPADLRRVIDKNSGLTWAIKSGQLMDEQDVAGLAQAKVQGHTIIAVEGGVNNPAWKGVLDRATEKYLAQSGASARNVYGRIQSLSKTCSS